MFRDTDGDLHPPDHLDEFSRLTNTVIFFFHIGVFETFAPFFPQVRLVEMIAVRRRLVPRSFYMLTISFSVFFSARPL